MDDEVSVADILRRAADIIEEPGQWVQHRGSKANPDGSLAQCMFTAINSASFLNRQKRKLAYDELMFVLPDAGYLDIWPNIITYNDAKGRTAAECAAKLRQAADRAEKK